MTETSHAPGQLHHVTRGAGAPLVVLHGFNTDHRMLMPLVEGLFTPDDAVARHYLDLPGMGESPGDGIDSTADVVAAVDAWLGEVVGDEPFLLLGQSFGGLVARELVRRHRDRVRGLALIVPVAVEAKDDRRLPEHAPLERDEEFLATVGEREAEEFCGLAVKQTPTQYAAFRDQVVPGLRASDGDTLKRIGQAYALDHPIETEPWDGPTAIVCARQDSQVGWRDQVDLLEHYPRATYAVLDGAGHNLHIERPRAVAALLTDWLDRC